MTVREWIASACFLGFIAARGTAGRAVGVASARRM
jgi:hypothetical protein